MERLDEDTKNILKRTEHLFMEYQDDITTRMYEILFSEHPEVKPMFEHARKHQPRIFAAAIMSHLISIDEPEVLQSFRVSICRRHVKEGVQEEHYGFMAEALFKAMREVLQDKVSGETYEAWEKWFYFLSNLLIERERDHYQGKHPLFPEGEDQEKHYYQDKFEIFSNK